MMGSLMPERVSLGASDVEITIRGSKMEKQHRVDGGATHASLGLWSNPARLIAAMLLSGAIAGMTVSAALAADNPASAADTPEMALRIEPIPVTGLRMFRLHYP